MDNRPVNPRLTNVPVLNASSTLQSTQFPSPSKPTTGGDTTGPSLSPSPKFREPAQVLKDDSMLLDSPSTPRRPACPIRNLSLNMPSKEIFSLGAASRIPLSPKLDAAETYGSPVIPRRSRGLDFSRAATNLHHSTLADHSSPDSSPTITGRAMNIPGRRRNSQFGGDLPTAWASRPGGDRPPPSSSLGSVNMLYSGSSSSSSDEEMETDDIDDSILSTPQTISRMPVGLNIWTSGPQSASNTPGWMRNSQAASNFMSFRNNSHHSRRHAKLKKHSSSSSSMASPMSRSPPTKEMKQASNLAAQSRRESISWAANQLHIDGSESDDGLKKTLHGEPTTPARDSRGGIVKRAVTRRSNMLPKTKGFARIKAALAEESTPVETELRREATVIKQTRENDMELEPSRPLQAASLASSPRAAPTVLPSLEDPAPFELIGGAATGNGNGTLGPDFKEAAQRNSIGSNYWSNMDQLTQQLQFASSQRPTPPAFIRRDSSGDDYMSMDPPPRRSSHSNSQSQQRLSGMFSLDPLEPSPSSTRATTPVPNPIDLRTANNKRRRDDDFDPMSFKRRAVSPGMSVQNSPVVQSPMQREFSLWGKGPSATLSHTGALAPNSNGDNSNGNGASMQAPERGLFGEVVMSGNGNGSTDSPGAPAANGGRKNGTKRVGMQGMNDTNDGLMKMSIE